MMAANPLQARDRTRLPTATGYAVGFRWRPLLVLAALWMLAAAAVLAGTGRAAAHAGHDHGADVFTGDVPVAPRAAIRSGDFDLVAVAEASRLVIYLDHVADNSPARNARITLNHGGRSHVARKLEDGVYAIEGLAMGEGGMHDLIFEVAAGGTQDLLAGTLGTGAAASAVSGGGVRALARASGLSVPSFASIGPVLTQLRPQGLPSGAVFAVILAGLGIILMLGHNLLHVAGLMLVSASALLLAHDAFAQAPAGPRSAVASLTATATDAPRRLADGSVFIPKATQRLLDVRTATASVSSARGTVSLPARLIADPSRASVVQSLTGGRVAPIDGRLPLLGQRVAQGDPLITVLPSVPAAESASLTARETEVNLAIRRKIEEVQLIRTRLSEGSASVNDLTRAQMDMIGLWRQRDRIRQALRGETLTAPVDGIVAAMNVRAGQIVQPQDVLIQIVDPREIWVEAAAYGLDETSGAVTATAALADGRRVKLAFRGRSQALRDQANVLHFRVMDPPEGLSVGAAVTVHAEVGASQAAIVVPRAAIVRNSGGDYLVYDHVDPERFVPRPVRVEGLDADRALVRAGLAPGAKIVVRAAEFVNQVR